MVVDEDEETVVVNLTSGATTRVSLPGTPTSIVSARSSQDSSSSSSSTKQLLPQQQVIVELDGEMFDQTCRYMYLNFLVLNTVV